MRASADFTRLNWKFGGKFSFVFRVRVLYFFNEYLIYLFRPRPVNASFGFCTIYGFYLRVSCVDAQISNYFITAQTTYIPNKVFVAGIRVIGRCFLFRFSWFILFSGIMKRSAAEKSIWIVSVKKQQAYEKWREPFKTLGALYGYARNTFTMNVNDIIIVINSSVDFNFFH